MSNIFNRGDTQTGGGGGGNVNFPLSLSSSSNFSGVNPVARGGTGASSAAAARANLGVQASGGGSTEAGDLPVVTALDAQPAGHFGQFIGTSTGQPDSQSHSGLVARFSDHNQVALDSDDGLTWHRSHSTVIDASWSAIATPSPALPGVNSISQMRTLAYDQIAESTFAAGNPQQTARCIIARFRGGFGGHGFLCAIPPGGVGFWVAEIPSASFNADDLDWQTWEFSPLPPEFDQYIHRDGDYAKIPGGQVGLVTDLQLDSTTVADALVSHAYTSSTTSSEYTADFYTTGSTVRESTRGHTHSIGSWGRTLIDADSIPSGGSAIRDIGDALQIRQLLASDDVSGTYNYETAETPAGLEEGEFYYQSVLNFRLLYIRAETNQGLTDLENIVPGTTIRISNAAGTIYIQGLVSVNSSGGDTFGAGTRRILLDRQTIEQGGTLSSGSNMTIRRISPVLERSEDVTGDIFSGATALTGAPADDDEVLIGDTSADDAPRTMEVTDFARHTDNISANEFRVAFTEYTFNLGSAIPTIGEVSWATGSTQFLVYPKAADAADLPQEFAVGEAIRLVQRNDTTRTLAGVISSVQSVGNYRQISLHNITYGAGGAPENDASIDVQSVGSLLAKRNINHPGDSWSGTGSLMVAAMDWVRRILELEADRLGGIMAARLVKYTLGSLTANSTMAQIQAQAIDSNLLAGANGRNSLWLGNTTLVDVPARDNYLLYGAIRCQVHQDISYIELRIPNSDDRTRIEFWKRDESGNSVSYSRLQAHASSAGTGAASNVELTANNQSNQTFTGHFVDNSNSNSDVLHNGDILEIRWGFIELGGGQNTGLDFRLATSGFWNPIIADAGAIRLAPTGADADYVRLFS